MDSVGNAVMAERKRKFFVLLPAFLVPFLAVFFYALGGGKGNEVKSAAAVGASGINQELPNPKLKDNKDLTKMSFYEQADKDSLALREKRDNDPYFGKYPSSQGQPATASVGQLETIKENILKAHPEMRSTLEAGTVGGTTAPNVAGSDNADKVYKKLAELNQALSTQPPPAQNPYSRSWSPSENPSVSSAGGAEQLQRMMEQIKQSSDTQQDAKMRQMSGMLDKIIAIQHPPSRDSLQRLSLRNRGTVYPVSAVQGDDQELSQAPRGVPADTDGYDTARAMPIRFYGPDDGADNTTVQNAITATIDENQTLVSGADVKLRLSSDMYVAGALVPAGTPITGNANLSGERLKIEISSITFQSSIYPVSLGVYDLDGVAGIYVPGSINRDVSKESADQALGEMNVMSLDQSVGAQAANAGIQAAKTLVSKKIRLVRVTVKDGYQVFLKDARGSN